MKAEGGGNGETRSLLHCSVGAYAHARVIDFSVKVVSDEFKGKVRQRLLK